MHQRTHYLHRLTRFHINYHSQNLRNHLGHILGRQNHYLLYQNPHTRCKCFHHIYLLQYHDTLGNLLVHRQTHCLKIHHLHHHLHNQNRYSLYRLHPLHYLCNHIRCMMGKYHHLHLLHITHHNQYHPSDHNHLVQNLILHVHLITQNRHKLDMMCHQPDLRQYLSKIHIRHHRHHNHHHIL